MLRGPTEQVECSKCGFIASVSRTSPLGSKPEITRIIQRGPVFEQLLLKALEDGTPMYKLCEKTGLVDCTLKRIVQSLGYSRGKRIISSMKLTSELFEEKRDTYRKAYLGYIASRPNATRSEIAKDLGAEQRIWMRYNDREWYESHAPARVSKPPPLDVRRAALARCRRIRLRSV
jgi:hypothetical protein